MLVVTTIHGTWAPKAAWAQEDSLLCQSIKIGSADSVIIRPFDWSGSNSFLARRLASAKLQVFLEEGLTIYPNARHVAIAHSHGGNILLDALEHELLRSKIAEVVCLSTPFITATERDISATLVNLTLAAMSFLALLAVIGLLAFIVTLFIKPLEMGVLILSGLMMISCSLAARTLFKRQGQVARYLAEKCKRFCSAQNRRPITDIRLLAIRAVGDEASGGLIMMQFAAWMSTTIWDLIMRIPNEAFATQKRWIAWNKSHKWLMWLVSVLVCTACFLFSLSPIDLQD